MICNELTRQCEPTECIAASQCTNPAHVCDTSTGRCIPPDCMVNADCGTGFFCSKAIGKCEQATLTCATVEDCLSYNYDCIDGWCLTIPCAMGCDANEVCHEPTSQCRNKCERGCLDGQACDEEIGVCYQNNLPFANARVLKNGRPKRAIEVNPGTTVTLSAIGSIDPDGFPVEFEWVVIDAPPGSGLNPTEPLPDGQSDKKEPQITISTAGDYMFGLWVKDHAGTYSVQDAAYVFAK